MSIGPDIKEVLEEVGTSFTYLSGETWVSGQYLRFQPNRQVTKPFIKEFFLEVELSYDTPVTGGDVITLSTQNQKYLIVNRSAAEFEDQIYKYDAVLYKTNVTAKIYRFTSTRDSNYKLNEGFAVLVPTVYGLITETPIGNEVDESFKGAMLNKAAMDFYLPHKHGVRVGDRIWLNSGEYYNVIAVRKYSFLNVDVAELEEDRR